MKLLIAFLTMLASLSAFSAEVEFVDTKAVDEHILSLEAGETAVLFVGREVHFGCWKKYRYRKLQLDSDVVVLRESLAHPAVVCDFPVRQVEGLRIDLKNDFDHKRLFKVQVPAGVSAELEDTRPRICTAIFTMMYHPETGLCLPASDGCIVDDLRAEGFEFAGNRCR